MQKKEEVRLGGTAVSLTSDLSCLQVSGGAEPEAALETLEKQLICPICLEIFKKPVVILPCQHNLCRKCANELYQPSLFQARTTMMVNSGRFRCPTCRHEVVLDRHGVYGLQRNLLVENIIDVYKQEVSNNNNNNATSPLPLPPPPAQVTCSDHKEEKVNIYCLTCQLPTCSLCKVFGAHQSCQVAPLTDVYQQQKDELTAGVTSLAAVNDRVQTLISELDQSCRNIQENCQTQKQNVCDRFNAMFSILDERRKAMFQRISCEQEEKTGHAQALSRCYGDGVSTNSQLVESALSSMEEPDMAAFVQNSRELITKITSATGSFPSEKLRPGDEKLSRYTFNFSQQEAAVRSIDFNKVEEDVPEEPEPEEARDPSLHSTEPKPLQEPSVLNSVSISDLTSPPVEPEPEPALGPGLDSVEPAGAVLQPETDEPDVNDDGWSQMKEKKEEDKEKEEVEEVRGETGRFTTAEAVKEGSNIWEHQEGFSTVQAVTLLFYLLAFLLILQRVWVYIGCFICT